MAAAATRPANHHRRIVEAALDAEHIAGAHDLIFAAHAVETDRIVLSHDAAARFADVPGVVAIQA